MTITDEMVEAAARAIRRDVTGRDDGPIDGDFIWEAGLYTNLARIALEAAEKVRKQPFTRLTNALRCVQCGKSGDIPGPCDRSDCLRTLSASAYFGKLEADVEFP